MSDSVCGEAPKFQAFGCRLTDARDDSMVFYAMKVEIPAIAFVRGLKVDHEPIFRFKDDWRPIYLIVAEFERALRRPWTPRRPVDLVLDTSTNVRK